MRNAAELSNRAGFAEEFHTLRPASARVLSANWKILRGRPMRLVMTAVDRTALILVAGCLLTSIAVSAQTATRPVGARTATGSCEGLSARQSAAYMEHLNGKNYLAASEIARKTADLCLDAGDLTRARSWFQAARAFGRQSTITPAQLEQFRRRYQEAVARVRPPQDQARAAERRPGYRPPERGTASQASQPAASSAAGGAQQLTTAGSSHRVAGARLPWIAAGAGLAVSMLGATVLLRRRRGLPMSR